MLPDIEICRIWRRCKADRRQCIRIRCRRTEYRICNLLQLPALAMQVVPGEIPNPRPVQPFADHDLVLPRPLPKIGTLHLGLMQDAVDADAEGPRRIAADRFSNGKPDRMLAAYSQNTVPGPNDLRIGGDQVAFPIQHRGVRKHGNPVSVKDRKKSAHIWFFGRSTRPIVASIDQELPAPVPLMTVALTCHLYVYSPDDGGKSSARTGFFRMRPDAVAVE